LLDAMKDTHYFGVAKVAVHNREHIVVLRPSGQELILHTMFYADEVRKPERMDSRRHQFKPKELELARRLIETLAGEFEPEHFRDEYQANVERLVEQKLKGEKPKAVPKPRMAPVVDLMQALQNSLN